MSNEERFEEIYKQYNSLVGWYLQNKLICNNADKEDVAQQVGMGVGKAIDRIEPGKEHAFIYKVIDNQIKRFIYYRTRDRKTRQLEAIESSEGDSFDLSDLCDEIARADDYEYFALLDLVESVLTEREFQIFIAYLQGFGISQLVKQFKTRYKNMMKEIAVIKEKLSEAFEREATFPYLKTRNRKNKNS